MRGLLDVNLLLALLDASHVFHDRAHAWWSDNGKQGWASCPLTEHGVVRIMANPGYSSSRRFTVGEVVEALEAFVTASDHEFWPDTLSLRDDTVFAAGRIHGGRQLTDLYLLALAATHSGRLVTFDEGIPLSAVKAARPKNLCVL